MKKALHRVFAFLLAVSLTACGSAQPGSESASPTELTTLPDNIDQPVESIETIMDAVGLR